jgi:quercetin dioxygenase-like cupin family protein
MKSFKEGFPAGHVRHHFVGQDFGHGVYAKQLDIPPGYVLVSHSHAYDHLSILASGTVRWSANGVSETLTGPAVVTVAAGCEHTLIAVTRTVWFCVHPTDCDDADKVDDVILETV